jgi:hypothetical protein
MDDETPESVEFNTSGTKRQGGTKPAGPRPNIDQKFDEELVRLRGVRLAFVADHIEPATAFSWIENGGRSS